MGYQNGEYIVLTSDDTHKTVPSSYKIAGEEDKDTFVKNRAEINFALPDPEKTWGETADAVEENLDDPLKGVVNKVKGVAKRVYDSMAPAVPDFFSRVKKSRRRLIPLEF